MDEAQTGGAGEAQEARRRTTAVVLALAAVVVADVGLVVVSLLYGSYLGHFAAEAPVTSPDVAGAGLIIAFIWLAQFVVFLLAAVLFWRWFRYVHGATRELEGFPKKYGPHTVAWAFFIPLLNLFWPQRIMRETWTLSRQRWGNEPSRAVGLVLPRDWINLWWGLFIITRLLDRGHARLEQRVELVRDAVAAAWFGAGSYTVDILAAVVTIAMIRSVTALQQPFYDVALPDEFVPRTEPPRDKVEADLVRDPGAARFCPRCGEQYRAGFDTCSDCAVPLQPFEQSPA